jgi:hypothetical protein
MLENLDLSTILNFVLGVFAVVGSGLLIRAKRKGGRLAALVQSAVAVGTQSSELVDVTVDSLDDNKVSASELVEIRKEAKDVKLALQDVKDKFILLISKEVEEPK